MNKSLSFVFVVFLFIPAFAKEQVISGTLLSLSAEDQSLSSGVSVLTEGTTQCTSTDQNGNYRMRVFGRWLYISFFVHWF